MGKGISLFNTGQKINHPAAEISNEQVKMKLYLPDPANGFYRGTRFDWSGVIYSLEYEGHQYFGEWSRTRDPLASSDITGPVDGFLNPGLGYGEAEAGGEFIRIGVGVLEKPVEETYQTFNTYRIIDNGRWTVDRGKDWIEFRHEVRRETGWAFVYLKRIELLRDQPGFKISYSLKNTGNRTIETDQFNHNFFMIDNGTTGPDFSVSFPFRCTPDDNARNKQNPPLSLEGNKLVVTSDITDRDVWISLVGFGKDPSDNKFEIVNRQSGAGVRVKGDKPLHRLVFWATRNTLCPETFVYLTVPPGKEEQWSSSYYLFTVK